MRLSDNNKMQNPPQRWVLNLTLVRLYVHPLSKPPALHLYELFRSDAAALSVRCSPRPPHHHPWKWVQSEVECLAISKWKPTW